MTKKTKTVIIVLSVFLALSVCALAALLIIRHFSLGGTVKAVVTDNYIGQNSVRSSSSVFSEGLSAVNVRAFAPRIDGLRPGAPEDGGAEKPAEEQGLYLHSRNPDENLPFDVHNMFPGDRVTKIFRVKVCYEDKVTVHYRADVREGYEKLAEVLRCRIVMPGHGGKIYDGLMKDMPYALSVTLTSDVETEEELEYDIAVYLETSVGNEYMEKDLVADFNWWADGGLKPPKTGSNLDILLVVSGVSLTAVVLIVIILVKKRKREEET